MSVIEQKYIQRCNVYSDIYEHLPTLFQYASSVNHVTECGVRGVVSSYAFANGLKYRPNTKLILVDIASTPCVDEIQKECKNENLNCIFYEQNDLECPMEQTDLLFIDTWHVYGQLKRELARWHSHVNKYIIMHDTTVDEWFGESLRDRHNIPKQSAESGIPINEITQGLWPAIDEFLKAHSEWVLEKRFTNNNGLTILKRI